MYKNLLVVITVFLIFVLSTNAQKNDKDYSITKSQDIDNTSYINANKILMFITNHGNFGRDLGFDDGYFGNDYGTYYPYVDNESIENGTLDMSVNYATGLWLGGKVNNEIRVTVSEFSSEYVPGPMESGTFMTDRPEFKVYKLYADSLESNPNSDYLNWPVDQGAPVDGFDKPLMMGHQMLWTVFNDADPEQHTNHNGASLPLGIEVQMTAWAQDEDGNDTLPTPTTIGVTKNGNSLVSVIIDIIDTTQLTGDDYMVVSEYDGTLGQIWHLINTTSGQPVLENQSDFSGTGVTVDGMLLKVYIDLGFVWEWEGAEREIGGVDWGGSGFFGGIGILGEFLDTDLLYDDARTVEFRWVADGTGQNAYLYDRSNGYAYEGYFPQNFTLWDVTPGDPERQINFAFVENDYPLPHTQRDSIWNPGEQKLDISDPDPATNGTWDPYGGREYFLIMNSNYAGATPDPNYTVDGWFNRSFATPTTRDILWGGWLNNRSGTSPTGKPSVGDIFRLIPSDLENVFDTFYFSSQLMAPITSGADGTSIYIKYKLYNKGGNQIDSCYISLWSDPDLGSGGDDFVGCDTLSNIHFCYNDGNDDNVYGPRPPAFGYKFIHGPLIPAPGENAAFEDNIISDFKNLGMTSFFAFFDALDPDDALESYMYMKGIYGVTGQPYVYLGDTLTFTDSGDPVTGTGDLDIASSNREMMASCGPFTFNPGDSQYVLIKMAVGQGNDCLSSITRLKEILNEPFQYPTDINDNAPVELPHQFSLAQNYPNPFNPATIIAYSLPYKSDVKLEIFNILGQKVTTLVNATQPAGHYKVEWDSRESDIASGVYFYKLTAGEFTDKKKMILLK